jgi:hypothetical protein
MQGKPDKQCKARQMRKEGQGRCEMQGREDAPGKVGQMRDARQGRCVMQAGQMRDAKQDVCARLGRAYARGIADARGKAEWMR